MRFPTLSLFPAIFYHLVLARVIIDSPDDLPSTTFDIVVVGGGLTGLAVAGRLSERDPKLSVLVVEAGPDNRTSPAIANLLGYGQSAGGPQDWAWEVEGGRVIQGGKTLGGSSSINGAVWTRGHAAQVDRYASLFPASPSSWSYDDLAKYMSRSETFHGPTALQSEVINATFDPRVHGFSGPVQASFPNEEFLFHGPGQNEFVSSCENALGLIKGLDQAAGHPTGIWVTPFSLDPARGDNRSSSAEAYLTPVEDSRENWTVLIEHMVTKILFSTSGGQNDSLTATGIEFAAADGTGPRFTVNASKQVILAAGAIQTPALLLLSGVGDPAILEPLGIKSILPLSGVGRNLQEQPSISFIFATNDNSTVPPGTSIYAHSADALGFVDLPRLFGNSTTRVSEEVYANVSQWADMQAPAGADTEAMKMVLEVEARSVVEDGTPILEMLLFTAGPGALIVDVWVLLPFSRGNVTIKSTDPFVKPDVLVGYLNVDFDAQVLIAGGKAVREIFSTPPLSALIVSEITPGLAAVPAGDGSEAEAAWRKYIARNFVPTEHPLGTAAMLPYDLGGVVDERLKVYGTANLRIVDGSVIPFEMPAHPSATLYGVAEKAADMILEDLGL